MAFERVAATLAAVVAAVAGKPAARKGFAVEDSDGGGVRVQIGAQVWDVTDPTGRVRDGDPVIVTETGNSGIVTTNLREVGENPTWWESAPPGMCLPWFGGSSPSSAWILAQGQSIDPSTDPVCASIYGGNFPDARDRHLLGASSSRAVRSTGGSEYISEGQMPSHSHGGQMMKYASSRYAGSVDSGGYFSGDAGTIADTAAAGSGQAYWPRYLAVNLIIRRG